MGQVDSQAYKAFLACKVHKVLEVLLVLLVSLETLVLQVVVDRLVIPAHLEILACQVLLA